MKVIDSGYLVRVGVEIVLARDGEPQLYFFADRVERRLHQVDLEDGVVVHLGVAVEQRAPGRGRAQG